MFTKTAFSHRFSPLIIRFWFEFLRVNSFMRSVLHRKLIVPQKEPSPLLNRKIEKLEAKFADMTDEELEELGDDDGELGDQSHMQSSMSGDLDLLSYTPPQVRVNP